MNKHAAVGLYLLAMLGVVGLSFISMMDIAWLTEEQKLVALVASIVATVAIMPGELVVTFFVNRRKNE